MVLLDIWILCPERTTIKQSRLSFESQSEVFRGVWHMSWGGVWGVWHMWRPTCFPALAQLTAPHILPDSTRLTAKNKGKKSNAGPTTGYAVKKKYGIIWEFFPYRRVFSIPKTFVNWPSTVISVIMPPSGWKRGHNYGKSCPRIFWEFFFGLFWLGHVNLGVNWCHRKVGIWNVKK